MALDRRQSTRGASRRERADAKEERRPFPIWTLIVIALCCAVWVGGAKLYADQMAAYDAYAAIRQAVGKTTFFPGVTIDGIELGGMDMAQAQAMIDTRREQAADAFSLVVAAGEKRWRITSEQVPMTFNADTILRQAYAVGRTGTLEQRYRAVEEAARSGAHFETGFSYDRDAVDGLVNIIADSLDIEARDASLDAFDVSERTFTFTKEADGYRVDRLALSQDILSALDAHAYDSVVVVQGSAVRPNVTLSQLEGHFGRISSFTTETTKDRDRNTNIELSANALNGKVVMPGETLSFNGCTGQRTGAKGYREAGAIAGGMLVDDTGGGVCQTSSTLFNAAVRADMKIVERYAHSWPSTYVNKGEDATVNWPSLDFVFRNEGKFPVFVVAWYEKQKVTVEFYGQLPEDGRTIDLESEVIRTIKPSDEILYTYDESLPRGSRQAGRKKRTGYVVDTYKVYRDASGAEIDREKLWTTTYRATQDEILFNDGSQQKDTEG